jgi:hypothetical protein
VSDEELREARNARTVHHINAIQRLQDCRVVCLVCIDNGELFLVAHPSTHRSDLHTCLRVLADGDLEERKGREDIG